MMFTLPECSKCNVKHDKRACRLEEGVGPDSCPTKHMQDAVERALKKVSGIGIS